MKTSQTILRSPFIGICCALLLFLVCFLIIHAIKLIGFGWRYQKLNKAVKKTEAPPVTETPTPVYYLIERKKRANKNAPKTKELRFKKS